MAPSRRTGNSGDDLFFRRLRIFLDVVENMSVSAAARRLGVSQPAVSQQIRVLEEMLGAKLFNRLGRELSLTETGRKTVLVARRLVGEVDDALTNLRKSTQEQKFHLRLGFSAPQIALPIARNFKQQFPGASLEFVNANSDRLFEKLRRFELDAIFVGLPEPHSAYECISLLRQPLIAIASHDHPFARNDETTIRELCTIPLIFRESGSYTRRLFFDAAYARGFEPTIGYEIASREATFEAVVLGLGVGTVLEHEAPAHANIKRIPIERGVVAATEYVVCHRELSLVPPVALLLDVIHAQPPIEASADFPPSPTSSS